MVMKCKYVCMYVCMYVCNSYSTARSAVADLQLLRPRAHN